jgi:hypothetical protein
MKRIIYLSVCSLLSFIELHAESTSRELARPLVWLKEFNQSSDFRESGLNFNPCTGFKSGAVSPGLKDDIRSLECATIFTVYVDSLFEKEKSIWQITGGFGDMKLTTRSMTSRSGKMNIPYEDKKRKGSKQACINTFCNRGCNTFTGNDFSLMRPELSFGGELAAEQPGERLHTLAEFMLFDRELDGDEIQITESYLALKYGISLEGDYLVSTGDILWDAGENQSHSIDIAGIGRDDRTGLYQKQSTAFGSDEKLVIGVNRIYSSNAKNNSLLYDLNFLLWGDNGETFRLNTTNAAKAGQMLLSPKSWLMDVKGDSTSKYATQLTIDTRKFLAGDYSKDCFFLVIDRSATPGFPAAGRTYIRPDSISRDRIAYFNDIHWDTDGSGKDLFTFGFRPSLYPAALEDRLSSGAADFEVFPNPTSNGKFQTVIHLEKPADVLVQVYDLSGRLVYAKERKGESEYIIDHRIDGPAANYIIRMLTPDAELFRVLVSQ